MPLLLGLLTAVLVIPALLPARREQFRGAGHRP